MTTAMPSAALPNPAPAARGVAADADDLRFAPPAYPFDTGPYARFPPPLGAGTETYIVVRRAIVAVMVAWVPLAVLATVEGVALRPNPRESFLLDVAAYSRYLLALPLLIIAEHVVLPKLGQVANHFATSSLVPASEQGRYHELVVSTRRWVSSPAAAVVILALAYLTTWRLTEIVYPGTISTWSELITNGERTVTIAARWRLLVSQPLYVMMLGLWVWRALVWARFLFKVARLDLALVASHPDHMGGLRFVNSSIRAFPIVGFAIAAGMAGNIADKVLFDGRSVLDYTHAMAMVEILVLVLFVGPLFALGAPLRRLRAAGVRRYGELASEVGGRFERQWLRSRGADADDPLHATDFSALADLYAVVASVREIKLIPIEVRGMAPLLLTTFVPFIPLLLLAAPLSEMLRFAVNLLL
jgi:hypothetical protein